MGTPWGISFTFAPGFPIGALAGGSVNFYPTSIGVPGQPILTFQGLTGMGASYTFWVTGT
jgi:hypothetical protein